MSPPVSRPDDVCQSLNANDSLPPLLLDTQLSPKEAPETATSTGSAPTCPQQHNDSTTASKQNSLLTTTLPGNTEPQSPKSLPKTPPPQRPLQTTIDLDGIALPAAPLLPPDSPLQTSLLPSLNPTRPPVAPQSSSQSPPATSKQPAHSPSQSPPTVTQNSSRLPHRTDNGTPSLSDDHTDPFKPPPATLHSFTHNTPDLASLSAQRLAKAPPSPTLSPSHPEPFLLNSVTFTSTSHLYSPVCSSSGLCSLDSLGHTVGLLPMMSSVPPQLATPPQTISPPPPPELTPPPAHLLGSDDEEQEDPSDYCKGEVNLLTVLNI